MEEVLGVTGLVLGERDLVDLHYRNLIVYCCLDCVTENEVIVIVRLKGNAGALRDSRGIV